MREHHGRIFKPVQNLTANDGAHRRGRNHPPAISITQRVTSALSQQQVHTKRGCVCERFENQMGMNVQRTESDVDREGHVLMEAPTRKRYARIARRSIRARTPLSNQKLRHFFVTAFFRKIQRVLAGIGARMQVGTVRG